MMSKDDFTYLCKETLHRRYISMHALQPAVIKKSHLASVSLLQMESHETATDVFEPFVGSLEANFWADFRC